MSTTAIVLMVLIVGGSWSTLFIALRKMIKMGKEEISEE